MGLLGNFWNKIRKRLVVSIVGGAVTVILQQLGIPEEQIQQVVALLVAYIMGQSISDLGLALKGSKKE